MKWLRDLISHWFGHETYDEAYDEAYERELPPAMTLEEFRLHNEKAEIAKEVIRRRLDGPERGIEGMQ